jgi:hypothetical protein
VVLQAQPSSGKDAIWRPLLVEADSAIPIASQTAGQPGASCP